MGGRTMRTDRCPVCRKTLTQKEYEQALGILGEREKHLHGQKADLLKRARAAEARARTAHVDGVKAERKRTQRLLAGKEQQIGVLKQRIEQLRRGSTPQLDGLAFQHNLVPALKQHFPDDDIKETGVGGDIVHAVVFGKQPAGVIVYECKRSPRLETDHIQQAHRARQSRQAEFAVLVTTATSKGFAGFTQRDGVLIVSPAGVLALARLLRAHIVEMVKARLGGDERQRIAAQLTKYITSPQFKNPLEEIITLSAQLQTMIQQEAKDHLRIWRKRWDHYQRMQWDGSQVRDNVQLALMGREPEPSTPPKILPLELPELTS